MDLNEFEQKEREELRCVAEIISQVLCERKPEVTDNNLEQAMLNEDDGRVKFYMTNLAFEIQNKDSNGRAILHRTAMDHKPDEME